MTMQPKDSKSRRQPQTSISTKERKSKKSTRSSSLTQKQKSPKKKASKSIVPTKQTQVQQATVPHILETYKILSQTYPDAHCELNYQSAFQLLVAVILSAQATDVSVNKATPTLFAQFNDAYAMAKANVADVEKLISNINMHPQKAKRLVAMARLLVERHQGQVPNTLEQLIELPGVGRKTANVVLAEWFKSPIGVVVDTHVQRISQRLGWTHQSSPEKIERDLMEKFPQSEWGQLAHVLIFHGRRTCKAVKPICDKCTINSRCPVAGQASNVGRKVHKPRGQRSYVTLVQSV